MRFALLFAAAAGLLLAQVRVTEITAHIVLEDGSSLKTSPLIVVDPSNNCAAQSFLDGTVRLRVPYAVLGGTAPGCVLSVRLTGYQPFSGRVEDGTVITLKRVGPHEDSMVSKSSLNVSPEARKLYEAGEGSAAHAHWAQAEERFRAALVIEPKYAAAWSELGRALREQNRLDDAVAALGHAREADPAYIKPIAQLAEIAGLQQRWNDELRLSQEAVKLHPVGFSLAWYTWAQGAFGMGLTDEAETIAREAIRVDREGQCPESMTLLGRIFEKQGHTADALVEYKAYLKAAPHGPDAEFAKQAVKRLR